MVQGAAVLASLAVLVPVAAAQAPAPGDPLRSAACSEALARLDQARQMPRTHPGTPAAVEEARAAAAQACLGSANAPLRPGRPLQPLAPPPASAAAPTPLPRPVSPPSPPVAIPRAAVITHCDASGCWAADGDRLRFVPAPALPPSGACVLVGARLHCP